MSVSFINDGFYLWSVLSFLFERIVMYYLVRVSISSGKSWGQVFFKFVDQTFGGTVNYAA